MNSASAGVAWKTPPTWGLGFITKVVKVGEGLEVTHVLAIQTYQDTSMSF